MNGLDMDQSMSLRGRIGYAAGRTLFYGTAGVSRMSGTSKIVEVPQNNSSTSFIRWTAGGGFDTELSDHLFLRVEYRYSDYSLRVEDLTSYTLGFEPRRHDVRVGIGFKL